MHEEIDSIEMRPLELGITPSEIQLAEELGLTLAEWHALKTKKQHERKI